MGGIFSEILAMLLLLVNDFLIVSYVSWIGHNAKMREKREKNMGCLPHASSREITGSDFG
jgi:hypothetical protein